MTSTESVVSSGEHEEHLRLAGIVKGVHADLRKQFKQSEQGLTLNSMSNESTGLPKYEIKESKLKVRNSSNLEKIWLEHCQNKAVLGAYADAMHHLAVDHWTKNQETRIEWCRNAINEYFHGDGLKKVLAKEKRRKEHEKGESSKLIEDGECNACSREPPKMGEYNTVHLPVEGKIRLLDVGSCFNPFLAFPEFQAVGIDISPATESVFHCDFLYLRTTDHLQVDSDTMTTFINNLKDPIDWLPKECFHVIVFSLLLEYFPARYQRWLCCQKAQELLMYNGILVIVTPDSSHQNRNAHMMKSWKIGIQSMGFQRVRYEKLEHLHCMIFRKIECTEQSKKDSFFNGVTEEMIYIPQDFNDICHDNDNDFVSHYTDDDAKFFQNHILHELPKFPSDSEDSS